MRRQIALSLILALTILQSLTSSVSPAQGQNRKRPVVDTGVVALGDDQVLRITVNAGEGNDTITVGFRRIGYTQGTCDNGVCTHSVGAQSALGLITLAPGEAASIDIPRSFLGGVFVGVRGVVSSSSRDVRVNAFIINAITGEIIATVDMPPVEVDLLG